MTDSQLLIGIMQNDERAWKHICKNMKQTTKEAVASLTEQMYSHAENERFEEAARCRDSIESMKRLGEGQKVVGSPDDDSFASSCEG